MLRSLVRVFGGHESVARLDIEDVSIFHRGDAIGKGVDPWIVGHDDHGAVRLYGDLTDQFAALALFVPALTLICVLLLRKQEK